MKKIKKKTAKKKAWEWFSKYIRLRDADNFGVVQCCTCGGVGNWKDQQAGHFISGRNNAILFEETGVNTQCVRCNIFFNGNPVEYFVFMERKYGRKEIERLREISRQTRKYSTQDYLDIANTYKAKAEAEANEKRLMI